MMRGNARRVWWGLYVGALALALGLAFALKAPCRNLARWDGRHEYTSLCYSDLIPLYNVRGFGQGARPYLDRPFEYPVLSGLVSELANRGTPGATKYFDRLALVLAGAAVLGSVLVTVLVGGPRPRAFAYALAPPAVLYSFQNFEQLAVLFAVTGLYLLRRGRPALAGASFGLGAAAKLFPGALAAGAFLVWIGQRRRRDAARLAVGTAAAWVLCNAPVAIVAPGGWWQTYTFHGGRVADWQSPLYWLSRRFGWDLVAVTRAGDVAGPLLLLAAAAWVVWLGRKRGLLPETGAALLLFALFLVNKVASPQFTLWLVPLLVLLDLPIGWLLALSAADALCTLGKMQWFGGPGGVGVETGWTRLFEIAVWARFVIAAAITVVLARRRPGFVDPSCPRPVRPASAREPDPEHTGYIPARPDATPPIRRRAWLLPVAAAIGLWSYRLGDPPSGYAPGSLLYVHDECYQAFTAHRYARGDRNAWDPRASREALERFDTSDLRPGATYEWVHPPTAKLVMAGLIAVFGFSPPVFRAGSVVFGALLLLGVGLLAYRMRGPRHALVATSLLACDGMVFVLSRTAMNDIYVTAALCFACYAVYRFWIEGRERHRWLVASGALFGLALSIKWSAAALATGFAAITLGRIVHEGWTGHHPGPALARALGCWVASFLVALPAVYLLSYVPYFAAGYGWDDLVVLHREMSYYHSHLRAVHPQSSPWYSWPWLGKPVWLFVHRTPQEVRSIHALGNPLLWWSFVPALIYVGVRYGRRRVPADGLILCGFLGVWLPWAVIGRVAFVQYLLPAVPFGVLAIATVLHDLTARWPRLRLVPALAVVCAAATLFHFYPILSAHPVHPEAYEGRRWFWSERWRN